MAESYSVRATLSAKDAGFTRAMDTAASSLGRVKGIVTSGLGFGILTGVGHAAFDSIKNGISGMVSELGASSAAWKTYEGNMEIFGKSGKEIKKVKKELQGYAQATIYSASDMAGTYSQLTAVGIKGADKLVTGFGGIASAAESPTQAMKTLSQQATQMAAKPYVAWQDFKLMLEQTPAGIAAVAKEMGMTTSELVTNVQDGTVATEDFFAAIEKVGNSEGFTKMATEYKTLGQAMDGLQETAANKLGPAFEVLQDVGIKAISGIADKIGEIDGDALASKVSGWIDAAQPYWESFKDVVSDVGDVIQTATGFLADHGDTIAKILPHILAMVVAYKALKIINAVVPGVSAFTQAIGSLAGKGISGLAGKLFGVAGGETAAGKAGKVSSKNMLAMAKSSMMLGAAVLLVAAGFALLAYSSIQLANAGGMAIGVMMGMTAAVAALLVGGMAAMKAFSQTPARAQAGAVALVALGAAVLLVAVGLAVLTGASIALANAGAPAIACMVGMVAAIALLAVGAAALGPALTAGSVGFIAFGAAILLVSAGALLASAALAVVASVLPTVCEYGLQGSIAILSLGGSMMMFAAGATLAGASAMVLGAGLVVLGAGALVASAGIVAFGAAMLVAVAGTLAMAGAVAAVNSKMKSIASNAKSANKSMSSMRSSMNVVTEGLDAIGSKAKSAMSKLTSAFDNAADKATSAGNRLGTGFNNGLNSGCNQAISTASRTSSSIVSALNSASGGAYSCGVYIGSGLANGMASQLGRVRSVAAQLAAAAEAAIRAKAQIHSPSRVTDKLGGYYVAGWVNSIRDGARKAYKVAQELVAIPNVHTPELAFAGGYNGSLSEDFRYSRNDDVNITVVSEIDGREVAKSTAVYTREEINKIETKNRRKRGLR